MKGNKLNFYLVVIVELVLCILGTATVCNSLNKNKIKNDQVIVIPDNDDEDKEDIVIDITILEQSIKEMSKLITAEYSFSIETDYSSSKRISDKWGFVAGAVEKMTTSSYTSVVKGKIPISIEFSEVKATKENNKIIITIPKAQMEDVVIDSIEFLDEKNNIFNPLGPEDTFKMEERIKKSMTENAINEGYLEEAEENAKRLIDNYMKMFEAYMKGYTVEVVSE